MEAFQKNAANFIPLTPLTFLRRAAVAYPNRPSVIYDETRYTWQQTYSRCRSLASWLIANTGISKGDVVSVLTPNIPAAYELQFAIPMCGAVINPINTRLDPPSISTIVLHSGSKLVFVDRLLVPLLPPLPATILVVVIGGGSGLVYEELVAAGDSMAEIPEVRDEWDAISLNYTSGTTSAPKGVVVSHRAAYLSALSILLQWGVGAEPIYLWTLPMFHCNGWALTWGVAARGGANVCLRSVTVGKIHGAISTHRVTHMCCVPTVLQALAEGGRRLSCPRVEILTGGSPLQAPLLQRIERMGFRVTHAYGMTEATGVALVCEWPEEWDRLPAEEKARRKARQGISALSLADLDVREWEGARRSVPRDGNSVGEIVLRGSGLMKGYFRNETATAEAFREGWLWTGDVGVVHPDGRVELKDRLKDVIISGGENICSAEVERVLHALPDVAEAAVVAMPHPHWGETPCAFLAPKQGRLPAGDEVIAHCRKNLPHFMVPKKVVFLEELPKNAAGKIEKTKLREAARDPLMSSSL